MILNILGRGGSGKTTLKFALLELNEFVSFLTYTTRPKRLDEIDGVHYNFVSLDVYETMSFVMQRISNGWRYGVLNQNLEERNDGKILVTTFDENGIIELEKMGFDVHVVHLDISEKIRKERMLSRGDSLEDVNLKLSTEASELMKFNFSSILLKVNGGSVEDIVKSIMDFTKQ